MKHSVLDIDEPTSTLGERIKATRLSWKWSQAAMAEVLKVDQASISFWERDKIKPCGSAIMALSSLFRTSPRILEEGTAFRIPDSPAHLETATANAEHPRSVSLPLHEKDGVVVVDLRDGSSQDTALSEALMSLAQGLKTHRRAWVVLE